jgi:hypothetical protein
MDRIASSFQEKRLLRLTSHPQLKRTGQPKPIQVTFVTTKSDAIYPNHSPYPNVVAGALPCRPVPQSGKAMTDICQLVQYPS